MIQKTIEFTGCNMVTGKTEDKKLKYKYDALSKEKILKIDGMPAELKKKKKTDRPSLPDYFVLAPTNLWSLQENTYRRIKREMDNVERYERIKKNKDEYYNISVDDIFASLDE